MYLLDAAWGYDSEELGAPQAMLMKMIIEGVMNETYRGDLYLQGDILAIVVEILGIPVLPFAIGVYLPVQLNACIMVGGLLRLGVEKYSEKKANKMLSLMMVYSSAPV